MRDDDNILEENVLRFLSKTKQHTTSLDFKTRLLKRIGLVNELKLQRQRYLKKALLMISITVVLALVIMFVLSGLDELFVDQANQLAEIIHVCLLSLILMLGGLILYVGNTFWEYRTTSFG